MKRFKLALFFLLPVGVALLTLSLIRGHNVTILNPKGTIGAQEKDLMITATLLMLIVVVPVFILTFFIAWRYRADNDKAAYRPEWDHSRTLEAVWWGLPTAIILALSVITWQASHRLDPLRPVYAAGTPLTVQVVSLDWKWLFIYPQQNIASVNYVRLPVNTPISFQITSDAPINSFWIPQLGGQVYSMAGMTTQLNLAATETGVYDGSSANISGKGFAGMRFKAAVTTKDNFNDWVIRVKNSSNMLSGDVYSNLSKPGIVRAPLYYSAVSDNLFRKIIMKYMAPNIASEAN